MAIFVSVLSLFNNGLDVFAIGVTESKENIDLNKLKIAAESFISTVEEELERQSTDVVSELENLIEKYTGLLSNVDEEKNANKIEALISTTNELISDYTNYQNGTRGSFHMIYSAEVATAISAFNVLGYDLSAELLTHAKDNERLDSYYTPVLGDDVTVSGVFENIKDGSTNSGSASFPNSGTTDQKDLYFSIHSFNYRKSNSGRVVIIEDRYDYAQGSMGSDFTGMVVNEMYEAQEAGVIVPYYTYIVQNTDNAVRLQVETVSIDTTTERRMFNENVVLGKDEYKELYIKFDTTGYKIFQTFGTLDTKIEIFNIQGNSLTNGLGDDNGYEGNALVKYYCVAGIEYRVRLYFYRSMGGEFMFSVTPANSVYNLETSEINSYKDIWAVSGVTEYTFNTWTVLNQTKLITFTAPTDGEYTFEILSEYDTYLYVIDPSSFSAWINHLDYDDDSGEGMNPKIVRNLKAGIPYLVVYSSYNVQNETSIGSVVVHISKS